jgi:hypothetical protein
MSATPNPTKRATFQLNATQRYLIVHTNYAYLLGSSSQNNKGVINAKPAKTLRIDNKPL